MGIILVEKICKHCRDEFFGHSALKFCYKCVEITFECAYCSRKKTIKRSKYEWLERQGHKYHCCSIKCANKFKSPCEVFGFRLGDKVKFPNGTVGFVRIRRKSGMITVVDKKGNVIKATDHKKLELVERALVP